MAVLNAMDQPEHVPRAILLGVRLELPVDASKLMFVTRYESDFSEQF